MADEKSDGTTPHDPTQVLEHALALARAKRTAAAAAREEVKRPGLLKAELEREERAFIDDEAIAKLEDELGPIGRAIEVIRTDLGAVVVKRAVPVAFKRFQDLMARENPKQYELCEQLVAPCLVHPPRADFDRMLAEQPHILIRCANKLSELAGVRAKEEAGK